MNTRRNATLVALLIALLVVVTAASAKTVPYVEPLDEDWGGVEEPFVPPSGAFFATYFGRLDSDDVDAISMTFEQPVKDMYVELLVPECGDLLADGYPALAVIGPGLDAPDTDLLAELPFEQDKHVGLVLLADGAAPDTDEPRVADVQLFYWWYYRENVTLQVDIPQAGEYVFVVWEPGGALGAYALTTGAGHPGQVQFPDERTMRETSRLLETGEWIGLDCGAEREPK